MSHYDYYECVWETEVLRAEAEIMHCTATMFGGRGEGESIESYVKRSRDRQDKALHFLTLAREALKAARKDTKRRKAKP